ncbi:MAG: type II toxin-antitoxin system VapC family toxin [Bacteroidales bacterium]
MVLDTSAILAVLFNEPEADDIEVAIDADPVRLLSAASYLETAIVVHARFGDAGSRELDLLIHKASIEIVTVTAEQADVGLDGWRRFGKGRHEAALNFGDCFAYALAVTSGEPLLFTGDDFRKTDVARVGLGID